MILVIGNGKSAERFNRNSLKALASKCYTFACNGCAIKNIDFRVNVSLDPFYIQDHKDTVKTKLTVSRAWPFIAAEELPVVCLPHSICDISKFSGIWALILADTIGKAVGDEVVFIGFDDVAELDRVYTAMSLKIKDLNCLSDSKVEKLESVPKIEKIEEAIAARYDSILKTAVANWQK